MSIYYFLYMIDSRISPEKLDSNTPIRVAHTIKTLPLVCHSTSNYYAYTLSPSFL